MPTDDPELAQSTQNSYTSNTALLIPCVSADDEHSINDHPNATLQECKTIF